MIRLSMTACMLLLALAQPVQSQGKGKGKSAFTDFETAKPLVGECAPRLHLKDTDGKEMDLREYLGSWVVMEFGSYT